METKRCKCGARIMWANVIESSSGRRIIHTCGVCGSQIRLVLDEEDGLDG